ncbi:DUF2804 domain-containing protein [Streptomyces sp. NBC_00887]|uniref:DUF2804 domain-containing protein n=1 Tax=Streptomyces sp. NBC_00887 TaxID=2975859 RepID=UPI00386EE784|nr:DUF2804 domain-containing protein [Streptomyces sp. NBC_00887]
MATHEHEITEPVDLCLPDGKLNPAAVGWSRQPLHRANLRGWGRTKRWEYWCVTTPTHLVALTVSDLDFLALNAVYVLEYGPRGREFECSSIVPAGRGVHLPDTVAGAPGSEDVVVGPARPSGGKVRIEIRDENAGTRLRARCLTRDRLPLEADILVSRPAGHESLSVVVPWSEQRFQYTSKHTALPATGRVRIGTEILEFGASRTKNAADNDTWAVLDHGRGRWPRAVDWNWGAASGRTDGRTLGLQFGGRWTAGTVSTENGLCVDGRLTKIGEELDWRWSASDPLAPWTVRTAASRQVDLTFTPFHNRSTHTDVGLIANRTDQCFGHYDGRVRTDDGTEIAVTQLLGWAEDVRMRW